MPQNPELSQLLSPVLCHNSWFLTETSCCLSSGLCFSGQPSHSTVPGEYLQQRQPQLQMLFFDAAQYALDTVQFGYLEFFFLLGDSRICRRLPFSRLDLLGDNFSFLNGFHHMHPDNKKQCNIKNQPSTGVRLFLSLNSNSDTFCIWG